MLLVIQRSRTNVARLIERARSLFSREPKASANVPEGIFFGRGSRTGKLAALFPGQGAQYPGMFRELACRFPALHGSLTQACQTESSKRDLIDRIYPLISFTTEDRRANEESLRATDIAQPALGAISLGAWRILEQFGVRADAAAGHSYGELTALCAAGRLKPDDFFRLSCLRGRLMADAGGLQGAMLAVQATEDTIREALRAENLDLVLANKNAPQQTVLSGPTAAIDRAAAAFAARQVRTQRLAVSAAFHSPLISSAAQPFRTALEGMELYPGTMPVFANSTAQVYPEVAAAARDLLAGQLARPVEFVREIEHLHEAGIRTFLEVGPGHRLTGLVSAILQDRDYSALALDSSNGQRSGVYDLACCLAHLAALGHDIKLSAWDADAPLPQAPVDSQKRTLLVPICGANYVKPKLKRDESPATFSRRPKPVATDVAGDSEPRPTMNGTPNPMMSSSKSSVDQQPNLPTLDSSALSHALQLTRDSLAALQHMQEQTAQLHRQFLDGQDAAQRTVQFLVEQQQRLLQASLGLPVTPTTLAAPPPVPVRLESPTPVPPLPQSTPVPTVAPEAVSGPPAPTQATPPAPVVSDQRIENILLEVIAEKTGYPSEMLELDMALDADLGIDSIKRVEILSALQERLPEAPVIKPEHLGTLHNLRDIAAFLAGGETTAATQSVADVRSHAERGNEGVERILLEVIAEKTGYPSEMLELDMALDADLGIDSIKRVEILSALQERLPEAPVIRAEHLGTLHNLRDIASFLTTSLNGRKGTEGPAANGQRQPAGQYIHQSSDAGRTPLERSVLRAVPLTNTSARPALRLQPGTLILIASDGEELAQALDQLLRTQGYRPRCVPVADLCRLERPATLGALVIAASRQPEEAAFLKHVLFGLQHVGPALRAASEQGGALFVTVSRLDGAFGLEALSPERDPLDGGLAGLAKTAKHEWPEVHCKAIDLADDFTDANEAAAALVEEMFRSGPVEVGLSRNRQRTLERIVKPLTSGVATPFQPGDLIVLSGGARGVTAEAAVALAHAFRPTLVLLGRTSEPPQEPDWLAGLSSESDIKRELGNRANGSASLKLIGEQYRQVSAHREIRQTLARIEAVGARALYRSVDIRDAAAVKNVLTVVCQQMNAPIRGVIHGAGVLADARIEDKTVEQFESVFATKVGGLEALIRAVDPNELRALVLFSSSTARFGRAGQVDYAIANEVLNKLAQQQARLLPRCRVVSVNWGPWDGGMVNAALKKVFAQEGIGLIPLQAGANYLVEELCSPAGDSVEVVVLAPGSTQKSVGWAESSKPTREGVAGLEDSAHLTERTSPSQPLAFERVLDTASHPVLESHILDGRPVLPTVLILEWLAHGALHQNPGFLFHGCNDLRILHGVILDGDTTPTLRINAGKAGKSDGHFIAPVELRGVRSDGRDVLHARAEIVLTNQLPTAPSAAPTPNYLPYNRSLGEVYQNLLFHGPDLQGIEQIEGCGEKGIVARVTTAPLPSEWIRHPLRQRWLTDPLALDCSFQLMVVWTQEQHGAPSLPCHLARYRQYQRAFPEAGVRVVAHVTRSSNLHALADIDYLDERGQVIARSEGYECVIDSALRRAFSRKLLASASTVESDE